ncbi:MAG: DUF5131 family protein [Melioribacteraceae bacterium]|nr:DUF5131 family protein [Melioribacteraceae bacterium]
MKEEWVEEIYQQCKQKSNAFLFKQWGTDEVKRNKKANGRKFKGRVWNEFPVKFPKEEMVHF